MWRGSDTARDADTTSHCSLRSTKEQTDEKILFGMRNAPLSTNHLFLTSVMDGWVDGDTPKLTNGKLAVRAIMSLQRLPKLNIRAGRSVNVVKTNKTTETCCVQLKSCSVWRLAAARCRQPSPQTAPKSSSGSLSTLQLLELHTYSARTHNKHKRECRRRHKHAAIGDSTAKCGRMRCD